MGNVMASSGPAPAPVLNVPAAPLPFIPPPVAESPKSSDLAADPQAEQKDLISETNPGPLDELHKKCKEIFPTNFDGAKFMFNKFITNHFQASHTINMSAITPSGYRFGATYIGEKSFGPQEAYPIFSGDIDPSGNLNASIIHYFNRAAKCKVITQIQNSKFVMAQLTSEYRGKDYTAVVTLGNPDLVNESGIIVAQYLQNVAPKLALGTELVYQRGSQVPGGEIAVVSLASRYTGSNFITSGTIGASGVHVCYYHRASEQLQIGVELDTNFRIQESVATIGYQIDLPKTNFVFRGMVDSNWTVGAVLEKRLQPLPLTLALSGLINHTKNQSRFGIGLFIG